MKRYVVGCLAGWALWIVCHVIHDAYHASISDVPKALRSVSDPVMTVVGIAAWPLAGGLWWLSGDNHLTLMQNRPLNFAVGMALWGTLGVLAAVLIHRQRSRSEGLNH
jgi:hypothetical protein